MRGPSSLARRPPAAGSRDSETRAAMDAAENRAGTFGATQQLIYGPEKLQKCSGLLHRSRSGPWKGGSDVTGRDVTGRDVTGRDVEDRDVTEAGT